MGKQSFKTAWLKCTMLTQTRNPNKGSWNNLFPQTVPFVFWWQQWHAECNIKLVVLWGLPSTLVLLWQETGRCVRDDSFGLMICYALKRSIAKPCDIYRSNRKFQSKCSSQESTSEMENFQNLILMYASIRHCYSQLVYTAKNRLVALDDHNAHAEREVMKNKDDSLRQIVISRIEDDIGMSRRLELEADDTRRISALLVPVPTPINKRHCG
ncbi:Hypothetical predicted protein [Mytilus galloprovincialis]|uniref:Uncharacterized protein n=1 Tax=Mytilus galloprovincialis TaxID=29158 RepID=A0A8B6GUY7_MYTGA|nr:Hypothetical predicted protein [Mytilus galloprovincialis]